MASVDAQKPENPLQSLARFLPVADIAFAVFAYNRHELTAFNVVAIVQGVIFLAVVVKKWRYAADFFFWSIVPIYPCYFGLIALGVYPPSRPVVYLSAAVLWVGGVVYLWRLRRRYIAFLAANTFTN